MSDPQPTVQEKMKALQAANHALISAVKAADAARKRAAEREVELVRARLAVRRQLEALQPDLPEVGVLEQEALGVARALDEFRGDVG